MSVSKTLRENPIFATTLLFITAFLAYVGVTFVGTFVASIFIYYCVRPLYRRLNRRTNHRSVIALFSAFALIIPVLALLSYTLLIAFQELHIYSSELADLFDTRLFGLDPETIIKETKATRASEILRNALDYIGVAGALIMHFIVVIALVFGFLRDGAELRRWFLGVFDNDDEVLEEFLFRVDNDLESVFFGNLLHAVLIAMLSALIYNGLNQIAPPGIYIPFPTLAGILTGASSIIPFFGLKIIYIPLTGYVMYHSYLSGMTEIWWFPALLFVIAATVIDGIPDIVLRSYVSAGSLYVTLLIFSYVFGGLLFGWFGLFLGPILMLLMYHFLTFIVPSYLDNGMKPQQSSLHEYCTDE